jgi:hypothetical protein
MSPARPRPFARMGAYCPAEQISGGAPSLLDYSLIRDGKIKFRTRFRAAVSRHADRLFARIRSVIKDRCADPDFGPAEVAAETGISLRCPAGPRSLQVSISAKLRTPAAFATMLISQEDSGIGLVMHRAPTSKEAVPLATG